MSAAPPGLTAPVPISGARFLTAVQRSSLPSLICPRCRGRDRGHSAAQHAGAGAAGQEHGLLPFPAGRASQNAGHGPADDAGAAARLGRTALRRMSRRCGMLRQCRPASGVARHSRHRQACAGPGAGIMSLRRAAGGAFRPALCHRLDSPAGQSAAGLCQPVPRASRQAAAPAAADRDRCRRITPALQR